MDCRIDRRAFLRLAGAGSLVTVSGLTFWGHPVSAAKNDFCFVQLSDTHWGFNNPQINPDSAVTLKKEIAAVNSLSREPDFIMFTGDLTHTTEDDRERRKRLAEFREIIGQLKIKNVKLMPGEHDAALDEGEAYRESFGDTHYTFDHKGIHFIVLDNVSNARSILGTSQLDWLAADLNKIDKGAPIIVFTHRPLFDLVRDWEWYTRDGSKALDLLMPYENVVVFYGHIHQEHHHMTRHIAHHACKGSMFPLPAPGSAPVNTPVPWDPLKPYKGLGFRSVDVLTKPAKLQLTEFAVTGEKETR